MDRAVDTTICAACHRQGADYRTLWCACPLCLDCRAGIVYACPVCGAHSLLADRSGQPGDWSGFSLIGALLALAVGMGLAAWLAR